MKMTDILFFFLKQVNYWCFNFFLQGDLKKNHLHDFFQLQVESSAFNVYRFRTEKRCVLHKLTDFIQNQCSLSMTIIKWGSLVVDKFNSDQKKINKTKLT